MWTARVAQITRAAGKSNPSEVARPKRDRTRDLKGTRPYYTYGGIGVKRLFQGGGSTTRLIVVAAVTALVVGATGAVASQLITGKDIQNGSIAAKELKKKLRKKIGQSGTAGAPGQQGETGLTGPAGPAGEDATYQGPHWGQIDRNTLGSPTVALRPGPFVGSAQAPPFGDGSLGLTLSDGPDAGTVDAEQATFGNEVDFVGDSFLDVDQVGFQVYTTGENNGRGNPNMPSIKFEVDPNVAASGSNYSTLQFMPSNTASNAWSGYIDGTTAPASAAGNGWFMSGGAGTATGCVLATPCTFTQLQTALDDGGDPPSILTVAVGKGRDYSWAGAVDGLRINGTVYDFEPFGVNEVPAS